jgi:adenylate cyclase
MLRIQVVSDGLSQQFDHASGALEFGRGPQRDVQRIAISDVFVSRNQLRVEELPNGRLRVENLSDHKGIALTDGATLDPGASREVSLPARLTVGKTRIEIDQAHASTDTGENKDDWLEKQAFSTVDLPVHRKGEVRPPPLADLGAAPSPEALARWLETAISLQQAPAGSAEFYAQTARAVGELIGLDASLVLLRRDNDWTVAGSWGADDKASMHYSRRLLQHVLTERKTIFQDLSKLFSSTASLDDIEAVVVSPVFGLRPDEVVGALYGTRTRRALARGGVRPLEAQLVQLLAAAVGSNLARAEALRTRVQLEQFFPPELVRELERAPDLLEGRNQEVTVLVSDLRGYTGLSQRLGPQKTCQLVRDLMERLSERIVEHGGVIVDYAGDGVLAMWNAPAPQKDHAVRACRAALAMQGELTGLNARWREVVGGPLALGIGLNTGLARVGNTGSSRKVKYGPHGHTVNLASRVQEATKKLGLPVLLSDATREELPEPWATRRLGRVRLPSVAEAVMFHELPPQPPTPGWIQQRDTYETALEQYENRKWARACQALMPLLNLANPGEQDDPATLKLIRRAWECLETRPENFEPVIEVLSK